MSISTLSKKTKTLYHSMSVSSPQFSLNGGHRNQGFIGQTSLSRSFPRTLMKNDVVRGYGTCCGAYNISSIIQSSLTYQNDSNVIKKSSMNTSGLLSSKYRWMKRGMPHTTIKPKNVSQSELITRKKLKAVECVNDTKKDLIPPVIKCDSGLPNAQKPRTKCISYDNIKDKYKSQSQYIEENLRNNCNYFIKPTSVLQHTPFACNVLK
jgi:hypothetical protein